MFVLSKETSQVPKDLMQTGLPGSHSLTTFQHYNSFGFNPSSRWRPHRSQGRVFLTGSANFNLPQFLPAAV